MFTAYLIVSALIFSIGAAGVMMRRNFLVILMSLEVMLNGAALMLIVFAYYIGNVSGQVMFIFVAAVAASETAIGLAVAIMMYRKKGSIDINDFSMLKK